MLAVVSGSLTAVRLLYLLIIVQEAKLFLSIFVLFSSANA